MRQETLIDTDILSEFFRGNSVVVANNIEHFKRIPKLKLNNWTR